MNYDYIPNIREKIVGTSEGKKPNEYWQGNLSRENQYQLKGYDNSLEEVNNFFNDLSLYEQDLKNALGEDFVNNIDFAALKDIEDNLNITDETKLLLIIRKCMFNYLEICRNEFGIILMRNNNPI